MFSAFTFWIYYVLKVLLLETITFSDAKLKVHKREKFFVSDFEFFTIL